MDENLLHEILRQGSRIRGNWTLLGPNRYPAGYFLQGTIRSTAESRERVQYNSRGVEIRTNQVLCKHVVALVVTRFLGTVFPRALYRAHKRFLATTVSFFTR